MWKLIQKILNNSNSKEVEERDTLNSSKQVEGVFPLLSSKHTINDEDEFYLNIQPELNHRKELTNVEILIKDLNCYSGYVRENTLRQIQENFEPEIFPHILDRLSDYVSINRELAELHILNWSKEENFSTLCINNFLLIASLDIRERADKNFLEVFFNAIRRDVFGIEKVLMSHQGKLSKVLLDYVIRYEWITRDRLLEICKFSKYQIIRHYWLDEILKTASDEILCHELKQSPFKDVQYRLLDALYHKDILTSEYLIELWESKFYSIMDYAYFILRHKKFDFNFYFQNLPIEKLSQKQARTRVFQWLLVKGSVEVFLKF